MVEFSLSFPLSLPSPSLPPETYMSNGEMAFLRSIKIGRLKLVEIVYGYLFVCQEDPI